MSSGFAVISLTSGGKEQFDLHLHPVPLSTVSECAEYILPDCLQVTAMMQFKADLLEFLLFYFKSVPPPW